MTPCRQCSRRAETFLCTKCQHELHDWLTALAHGHVLPTGELAPGWLENLTESALGQARIAKPERRSPRHQHRLDGDSPLLAQLEEFPDDDETNLPLARVRRQQASMRHALGQSGINARASELLNYTHSVLWEWVTDIAPRVADVPPPRKSFPTAFALYLAKLVYVIAQDEAAHVCYREIRQIIHDIERTIDRPAPLEICGQCTAPIEKDGKPEPCGTTLMAKPGATEIVCPARNCTARYNTAELRAQLISDADGQLFDRAELRVMLRRADLHVAPSTLRRWIAKRQLEPQGYRGTEPLYLLAHARRLRDDKPQKAATGAAAKRKRAK